ncbi:pentatricopeptide repeat-containing protein At1g59720, chloroplastic/mitochondrial, partial [Arachis hypogaea]|uniref:pentatricopeptide repeat-containing protein At1g59720, chloroplastic/mitochondrial n=1 Tax=Arachis hypogaea TaxID=3818 RepID=UPI003B215450
CSSCAFRNLIVETSVRKFRLLHLLLSSSYLLRCPSQLLNPATLAPHNAKREPIPPITLELLLPLSVIDLTTSPPSISRRRRRNELRSHRRYRAALFHHRAATVSALKASSRSSVPSSPGSPPFSVEQLCSIVAGAISVPFSFTWNTLIRAYARTADQKHKSMELYRAMLMMEREQQSAAVIPDNYTYRFVLKACAYLFSLSEGKQVNAHVLKLGFESDTHICNSLIHFYATCGFLDLAHKVFEKMSERSEVSWNIMIDSYASAGEYDTALRMFCEMQRIHDPDGYTMQSVISSCTGLVALSLGLWAHAYILKSSDKNMIDDVLVNTSLCDSFK